METQSGAIPKFGTGPILSPSSQRETSTRSAFRSTFPAGKRRAFQMRWSATVPIPTRRKTKLSVDVRFSPPMSRRSSGSRRISGERRGHHRTTMSHRSITRRVAPSRAKRWADRTRTTTNGPITDRLCSSREIGAGRRRTCTFNTTQATGAPPNACRFERRKIGRTIVALRTLTIRAACARAWRFYAKSIRPIASVRNPCAQWAKKSFWATTTKRRCWARPPRNFWILSGTSRNALAVTKTETRIRQPRSPSAKSSWGCCPTTGRPFHFSTRQGRPNSTRLQDAVRIVSGCFFFH